MPFHFFPRDEISDSFGMDSHSNEDVAMVKMEKKPSFAALRFQRKRLRRTIASADPKSTSEKKESSFLW
jgi:hypothetical protein